MRVTEIVALVIALGSLTAIHIWGIYTALTADRLDMVIVYVVVAVTSDLLAAAGIWSSWH